MHTLRVPDALEMLEFFEAEPVEAAPEDGYWCYEVAGEAGVRLRFSFNTLAQSVETVIWSHGHKLISVTEEGAEHLSIRDGLLVGSFEAGRFESRLEVRIKPRIEVTWSRLRIA
ncbi:MAG: hypothetical protein ACLP59_21270 [Bryobacteraceae bacterium]